MKSEIFNRKKKWRIKYIAKNMVKLIMLFRFSKRAVPTRKKVMAVNADINPIFLSVLVDTMEAWQEGHLIRMSALRRNFRVVKYLTIPIL